MGPRTWVDGVEVDCSEPEWAVRAAGFLGCGFRLVVPAGPERPGALRRARELAGEVAAAVGGVLDEVPWRQLARTRGAYEVVGGWTHQFRGPVGVCATRVTPLPVGRPKWRAAPGVTLPWAVNEHSPVTGLPTISRHGAAQAARHVAAHSPGAVGLWTDSVGCVVDTTAGPPLMLTQEGWRHPTPTRGTVPHHLWERAAELLGAAAGTTPPGVVRAVLCVGPDGSVTSLTSVDGTPADRAAHTAERVRLARRTLERLRP